MSYSSRPPPPNKEKKNYLFKSFHNIDSLRRIRGKIFLKGTIHTQIQCDVIRLKQFCVDVALKRVNVRFREEDNIIDQIYEQRICLDFIYDDFYFYNKIRKILI